MRIEYLDKAEQCDPANQQRVLYIKFDDLAEIDALNSRGTPERILDYARRAMNAFLAENRLYGSQIDRGRSE